jgi:L-ascorbate metabolism protein UlaG (beta-lactamase superfamily)
MALPLASAQSHEIGQAKYLGNEGVLVSSGEAKILFDAFYAESFAGQYTLVPTAIEAAMMEGKAPFDGVDAIFISHIHPDHFNSRKTIAYMRAHTNVRLYAGIDVVGAIRAADASSDPLMDRVVPVHVPVGAKPATFSVDGLEVEAFAIPHSGEGPTPHYAFRVSLDRRATVMHLGDADADERHYVPYQADFDRKRTDMAFAPAWMLTDVSGRKVLEQRIRAAKVVGIHVEDSARKNPEKARKDSNGDLFLDPGETRPIEVEPR